MTKHILGKEVKDVCGTARRMSQRFDRVLIVLVVLTLTGGLTAAQEENQVALSYLGRGSIGRLHSGRFY